VALIFICVFLAFNFGLSTRFFEAEIDWFKAHCILSGVRLFELSIFFIIIIHYVLVFTKFSFRTDWLMRLSGLMLDMTCIAKLASAIPAPTNLEEVNYGLVSVFVLACTIWNVYVFIYFAKDMFSNFYFERAVVLSADCMGHPEMGLLFARTLDPEMSTLVPVAYICKLAMFIVPSSGGKNTIVISLLDRHGPFVALMVCVCVVGAWAMIFDQCLKSRYINTSKKISEDFLIEGTETGTGSVESSKGAGAGAGAGGSPIVRTNISSSGLRNREERGRGASFNFREDNSFTASDEKQSLLSKDNLEFDDEDKQDEAPSGNSGGNVSKTSKERFSSSGDPVKNDAKSKSKDFFPAVEVKMSQESSIVSKTQFQEVASWLPTSDQTKNFVQRDGASLCTLLALCHDSVAECFSSLIVIEDSWGYIFGRYVGEALTNSRSYSGSGQSFVYSLMPSPQVYRSSGVNSLFVLSSVDQLLMGGGGDGFAFQLNDELNTGVSNKSDTYRNPQLASNEFFKCLNVEVWTTENPGYSV
jgi:hypothetical protein